MSNGNKPQSALVQAKHRVQDLINSDRAKAEIAKVLPKHVTPERMTRVALTATLKNPALLECSQESLMNALLICSQAGLEPDGRLAHLIPYGKVCQVIFDYKGLVTLALRNGAESVFADKVCEFDFFEAGVENGQKILNHKINWKENRGSVVAYYSVCKRNGEVDWEVMTMEEVDAIRERSRAKDSGPWKTDFDEMGKKTVLRRMSKRWDLLPEIRDVINADDDTPSFNAPVVRPIFSEPKQVSDAAPDAEGPQPDAPAEHEPEPVPSPTPEPVKDAPLKLLRGALKSRKFTETELLEYLRNTGMVDDTMRSLEEVVFAKPSVIDGLVQNWAEFAGKIDVFKKGAK